MEYVCHAILLLCMSWTRKTRRGTTAGSTILPSSLTAASRNSPGLYRDSEAGRARRWPPSWPWTDVPLTQSRPSAAPERGGMGNPNGSRSANELTDSPAPPIVRILSKLEIFGMHQRIQSFQPSSLHMRSCCQSRRPGSQLISYSGRNSTDRALHGPNTRRSKKVRLPLGGSDGSSTCSVPDTSTRVRIDVC